MAAAWVTSASLAPAPTDDVVASPVDRLVVASSAGRMPDTSDRAARSSTASIGSWARIASKPGIAATTSPPAAEIAFVSDGLTVASIYVPNGGKDFQAKMRFLEAMDAHAAALQAAGRTAVLCGDLNVALTDLDLHPKERKPRAIGQLPEERALLDRIISRGLVDVGRALAPDDEGLFTWWAPWRNMRQRNIGWRIDYVLASQALAARATACPVQREVGTSDHAPVMAVFG